MSQHMTSEIMMEQTDRQTDRERETEGKRERHRRTAGGRKTL